MNYCNLKKLIEEAKNLELDVNIQFWGTVTHAITVFTYLTFNCISESQVAHS
jgi:hypothetical protein